MRGRRSVVTFSIPAALMLSAVATAQRPVSLAEQAVTSLEATVGNLPVLRVSPLTGLATFIVLPDAGLESDIRAGARDRPSASMERILSAVKGPCRVLPSR